MSSSCGGMTKARRSSLCGSLQRRRRGCPKEVFKTTPFGEPGLANAHKDHTWGNASVENKVLQWFRYMSVPQKERVKIVENEWQAPLDLQPFLKTETFQLWLRASSSNGPSSQSVSLCLSRRMGVQMLRWWPLLRRRCAKQLHLCTPCPDHACVHCD